MFNAEIWYGVTKADINQLEDLDRLLLRRILKYPTTSPKELCLVPNGEIIKIRMIQYLHHLATRDKTEKCFTSFSSPSG